MRYVSGAIPLAEQVVDTSATVLGLRGTTFDNLAREGGIT